MPGFALKEPLDLIRFGLAGRVHVKLHYDRELRGDLHAYDHHLNMILGNVEEVVNSIEIDDNTFEEIIRTSRRSMTFVFVRGEGVVLVSPTVRTSDML